MELRGSRLTSSNCSRDLGARAFFDSLVLTQNTHASQPNNVSSCTDPPSSDASHADACRRSQHSEPLHRLAIRSTAAHESISGSEFALRGVPGSRALHAARREAPTLLHPSRNLRERGRRLRASAAQSTAWPRALTKWTAQAPTRSRASRRRSRAASRPRRTSSSGTASRRPRSSARPSSRPRASRARPRRPRGSAPRTWRRCSTRST